MEKLFCLVVEDCFVALEVATVFFMGSIDASELVASNSAQKYEFLSNISTRIIHTTQNGKNTGTGNVSVCAGIIVAITSLKLNCLFCWTQTTICYSTS